MKNKRREAIIEIVQNNEIFTQEELQGELRKRGFEVTQATVSRDIRKLRLLKRQTADGKNIYAVSMPQGNLEQNRLLRVLRDSVRSIDSAQNILVIKTVSGMAMAVAAALDSLRLEGVVGSIAGDDTIMCAVKTVEDTEHVIARLRKIIADNRK